MDVRRTGLEGEAQPIFPFFVGCARSGTTLLRAIFDSHDELAIPDETPYFTHTLTRQRKYSRHNGFEAGRFLEDLFAHPWFPRLEVPQEAVRTAVLTNPPDTYAEAVRRIFALYAQREGKPRYGDKTPRNVTKVEAIARTFPEARFVHIIRDGRNVALSMLEMPWGPRSIVEAARTWKQAVVHGRRAGRVLGTSRYREVQYEQLLEEPEEQVRPLCQFMDLPFHPMMLRYFERAEQIIAPSPSTRGRVALPPTKGLRDWRTQMTKGDLEKFELIAWRELEELGYERGAAGMPLRDQVTTRLAILSIDTKTHATDLVRSLRRFARRTRGRARRFMARRAAVRGHDRVSPS